MKLSTKARYGLRVMETLVNNDGADIVAISALAAATNVTEAYLEQIMPLLKRADLVTAVRGAGGGYRLARDPALITIGEVVRALEDNLEFIDCLYAPCGGACKTHGIWTKIYNAINGALDEVSLEELKTTDGTTCTK
ncbi:MAG: Rrf2 family transcriptional regulator [Clostridiaceae bacterium]|jgi:Rrf2 family protein|nr:Rrf2 family transcriptional regulator [Clostridiaceae bacterium]